MSGAKRTFDVEIVGIDKSGPAFKRLDDNIARADAPIRRMNQGLGDVARASRFETITNAFRGVGNEIRGVNDLLAGALLPSFAALAGGATLAGAVAITRGWFTAGAEIKRTSELIGIAESELQSLRGAMALAGAEASNLDAAWLGFADSLQRAKLGDTNVIAALNALGVAIPDKLTPKSIRAALDQAIAGLQQFDAHGRRFVANVVGISSALPLFGKGIDQVRALEMEWRRLNAEMGPGSTKAAEEAQRALKKMELSATGLSNALASSFGPVIAGGMDVLTFSLANLSALAKDPFAYAKSVVDNDTLAAYGQDPEHLTPLPLPSSVPAPAIPTPSGATGVPWHKQKRIIDHTEREYRDIGRRSGVSGPDGRVIIQLKVESEQGLRTRAIVQDEGTAQTEVLMQPGSP